MDCNTEHHEKARGLGFDDALRAEVDRAGLDWLTIFELIDKYGPMVLEILKRLLLGGGVTFDQDKPKE